MLNKSLLLKHWNATKLLVKINIYNQNKNTFLGSTWTLLQPFIYILTTTYFFSFLLKQTPQNLIRNLVGGLPVWTFFTTSLTISANSIINRSYIIKKTIISKPYFPIADILVQLYVFAYSFIAMYIALIIFYPSSFNFQIFLIPIYSLPLIFAVISMGITGSFLTVYIRDVPQLLSVVLQVAYWSIPILYPYELVPENKRWLFEINPIFILIRPIQTLITSDNLPDWINFAEACGTSLVISFISYQVYRKIHRNVIYYL